MKIVYQGYYGFKNSGDDAFVEVGAWGTAKFWKCNEHTFLAKDLPSIITSNVENIDFRKNVFNMAEALYYIYNADIFLSAGGSTFSSLIRFNNIKYYSKYKKHIKGKIGAIGVSIGPYKTKEDEQSIVNYLRSLDFLALRDTLSYNIACSYNLPYKPIQAFDLAALLPHVYDNITINKSHKHIIGISLCYYERYINANTNLEEQRNDYILNLIKSLSKDKNLTFRFFIFNGNSKNGDELITNNFLSALSKNNIDYEIIPYCKNVKETFLKVGECKVMISTRLHASIFACYANVPFFLFEYHRKCADFLDDIGQDDKYRVFNGEKNINSLMNTINSIIYDNNYTKPKHFQNTINKALKNFTEINIK